MNPSSSPTTPPDNLHSPSLKQKLKSSLKLPACFHVHHHHDRFVDTAYATPRLVRSSTFRTGSRGSGHDHITPDHHFADKAKHFISSRLGGGAPKHRRRHSLATFHYDAASYSLNFDDGGLHEGNDSSPDNIPPFRTFSSRLPASPPRTLTPLTSTPVGHPSVPCV